MNKNVDSTAMFKLSYGLFVLTARDGEKDNGCIINTCTQLTDKPLTISVCVNKSNLTHDMIAKTGIFNVSVLTTETPFETFTFFGFQSGRDVNKFEFDAAYERSENGVFYLKYFCNSFISAKVINSIDCGTHTMFIAEVTEASVLSNEESVTYEYYHKNIKPKPEAKKKGYVCRICGYIHEGDTLPEDFICPICGHGVSDFEAL